jgi:serine protease Do
MNGSGERVSNETTTIAMKLDARFGNPVMIATMEKGTKAPPLLRHCAVVLLCAIVLALPAIRVHAGTMPIDWSSIVRQTMPCVVNIATDTIINKNSVEQRSRDVGSGFLIDRSGIIATNKHVIAKAFHIIVTMSDRSQWNAQLIATAPILDFALVKIDVGHPLPFLKFADSEKAEVGEPVILFGNPFGLGTSVSSGIVSAVHRDLMNTPTDDYIQTDAALNRGSSGGPMIDRDGNVLGISTILVTKNEGEGFNGLGFAISGTAAAYTVRHLLHPDIATVGWIGVHVQDVSPPLKSAFHLSQPGGFLVTKVDTDSPAVTSGLRFGDVITRYGNAMPSTASGLMRQIIRTPINTTVPLTFKRDGKTMTAKVTVTAWKDMRGLDIQGIKNMARAAAAHSPDFGIVLAPMSEAAREFYKVTTPSGVVVAAVDPASEAFANGMKAGDVVLAVGDQAVTSAEEAMQALARARASEQFVALLVSGRDDNPRWLALYSGYLPMSQATGESDVTNGIEP